MVSGPNNLITSHDTFPPLSPGDLLEQAQRRADTGDQLSVEAMAWAKRELEQAQAPWNKYGAEAERASESFLSGPNALARLDYFYESWQRVSHAATATFDGTIDTLRTLAGTPVGETMKLVYVPWRQFSDVLTGEREIPERWLAGFRVAQSSPHEDYGYGVLMDQLRVRSIFYRAPNRLELDHPSGWIDAKGYLRKRMEEDGDWGLVLAQTGADAGITGPEWQAEFETSPEADEEALPIRLSRTASELRGVTIRGADVSGMGVFEATAITLAQQTPSAMLPPNPAQEGQGRSMSEFLLANANPFNFTVPQLRAEGQMLCWDTHYGENQLAADTYMRLCVV